MAATCLGDKMNLMVMKRQKRREKSRDAARFRRHKESNTFEEICSTIPISQEIINHLDKSAIMRLLISYIKLRQVMNTKNTTQSVVKEEFLENSLILNDEDYVDALHGFLLILSSDLDVLYVSDNVKEYLGLSKFDLMGQSVLAYTHEGDHDDLKVCFDQESDRKTFFLRLKSTLTVNGKSINLKSASYKVLRCSGVVCKATGDSSYLVAHAEPLPHPANIEHLLDSNTFVSQHSPDMKFTYCDEKFSNLLGYDESDLLDRSYFDLCHVADMKSIGDYFHKLYRLNQVETNLYRLLSKTGGYYWIVTQATVINNQKSHKPQCIVCVHYVISGLEHEHIPLSSEQLENRAVAEPPMLEELQSKIEAVDEDEMIPATSVGLPFESDMLQYSPLDDEDDDCNFVQLTFTDLDDSDDFVIEDLHNNAPSIGDPWPANPPAGSIEDLFTDVVVDEKLADQTSRNRILTYNPHTLEGLPPMNSVPESIPVSSASWANQGAYENENIPPSAGSVSPCDSAYYGSPSRDLDPFNVFSPRATIARDKPTGVVSARQLSDQGGQAMSWQSVGVPREQYARHVGHLKRGHIEMEPPDLEVSDWVDSKMKRQAKRRCVDPPPMKAATKVSEWRPAKVSPMLLQPGASFGCENNQSDCAPALNVSFLLQPELNLQNKYGQQVIRNLSSGFLPELTVQDCEVNAPLPIGGSVVPLAADCVHLLDNEA